MSNNMKESNIPNTYRSQDVRYPVQIGHPEHVQINYCPITLKNRTTGTHIDCRMSDISYKSDIQNTILSNKRRTAISHSEIAVLLY